MDDNQSCADNGLAEQESKINGRDTKAEGGDETYKKVMEMLKGKGMIILMKQTTGQYNVKPGHRNGRPQCGYRQDW